MQDKRRGARSLARAAGWCWLPILLLAAAGVVAQPPTAVITIDIREVFDDPNGFPPETGYTLTRGYAPFPVFFQGWQSSPRDEIVRWSWDFGPGTETDELGRTFEGFNAAHVFETPGEYTVTLRTMSAAGQWSAPAAVTIEVLSRQDRPVYYVDAQIGDDALDGRCQTVQGGCGPWRSADKAFRMLERPQGPMSGWPIQPGSRILFRRGQVFPIPELISFTRHGGTILGVQYGAYGDPALAKPVLRWAGLTPPGIARDTLLVYSGEIGGFWVFSDLAFDFLNEANGDSLGGLFFLGGRWRSILILRCDFYDSSGLFASYAAPERKNTGIYLVSSTMQQPRVHNRSAGFMGGNPAHTALLNNRFDLAGNHMSYFSGLDKAVIAGNVYSRPPFGRTALRITGGAPGDEANNIYVADNLFLGWVDPVVEGGSHGDGQRYNYELINFAPGGNTAPRLIDHLLFERNILTNFEGAIDVGNAWNLTIRNNLFVTPSRYRAHAAIRLGHRTALGRTRPLRDVQVYGNTFVSNEEALSRTLHLVPFVGDGSNQNVRVFNNIFASYAQTQAVIVDLAGPDPGFVLGYNLYFRPGVTDGRLFRFGDQRLDLPDWQAATGNDGASLVAAPGFAALASGSPHASGFPDSLAANIAEAMAHAQALKLLPGSFAIDSGAELGAALYYDFDGGRRPYGSATDIGAYEYGSSAGDLIFADGFEAGGG